MSSSTSSPRTPPSVCSQPPVPLRKRPASTAGNFARPNASQALALLTPEKSGKAAWPPAETSTAGRTQDLQRLAVETRAAARHLTQANRGRAGLAQLE